MQTFQPKFLRNKKPQGGARWVSYHCYGPLRPELPACIARHVQTRLQKPYWLDIKEDAPPQDIFRAIGKLRKDARDEI